MCSFSISMKHEWFVLTDFSPRNHNPHVSQHLIKIHTSFDLWSSKHIPFRNIPRQSLQYLLKEGLYKHVFSLHWTIHLWRLICSCEVMYFEMIGNWWNILDRMWHRHCWSVELLMSASCTISDDLSIMLVTFSQFVCDIYSRWRVTNIKH